MTGRSGSRVPHHINGKPSHSFAGPLGQSFHLLIDRSLEVLFSALGADAGGYMFDDFEIVSPPEIHARELLHHLAFTEVAGLHRRSPPFFLVRRQLPILRDLAHGP